MPSLVSTVIAIWALAVALMLLWCVTRRRNAQPSPLAPAAEDNNVLHNRIGAAREQLDRIENPIEKNAPTLRRQLCQDKNCAGAGSKSDERPQEARFPRVPPPPPYSMVDREDRGPPRTSKRDNWQPSRTERVV